MLKILFSLVLIAVLSACASSTERQDQCTPQWPPGPCVDPPPRTR